MQLPNRPQKSRVERIDGQEVTFRLYDRRVEHDAVIEIEVEATWIVAVDDGEAELIDTTAAPTVADASVPQWTRDALRDAGVPASAI
jgi:hypothetical protein